MLRKLYSFLLSVPVNWLWISEQRRPIRKHPCDLQLPTAPAEPPTAVAAPGSAASLSVCAQPAAVRRCAAVQRRARCHLFTCATTPPTADSSGSASGWSAAAASAISGGTAATITRQSGDCPAAIDGSGRSGGSWGLSATASTATADYASSQRFHADECRRSCCNCCQQLRSSRSASATADCPCAAAAADEVRLRRVHGPAG